MKKFIYLFVILLFTGLILNAQTENKSSIMVGNKVILENDIKKQAEILGDYKTATDKLILDKLLIYQAEKEGIKVTPEEIEAEMNLMKGSFPDEKSFLDNLSKNNISFILLKQGIEEKIKTNKLVHQKVISKIRISQIEIMKEAKKIKETKGHSYYISLKWFNNNKDAEKFILEFDKQKINEMSKLEWVEQDKIIPEVFSEIQKIKEDQVTPPIKINERYLVVYLKERTFLQNEKLFAEARNVIYQEKFFQMFNDYITELRKTIPVFTMDK